MDAPEYTARTAFEDVRGERGLAWEGLGLWCSGTLKGLGRPSVALVGTRAATPYGRRLARTFARELGEAGCSIVSGLALGIDAAAHEGALDAGAPTIGVLGSGHHRFFPRRNRELAERMIATQGAVLSPFPPNRKPRRGTFSRATPSSRRSPTRSSSSKRRRAAVRLTPPAGPHREFRSWPSRATWTAPTSQAVMRSSAMVRPSRASAADVLEVLILRAPRLRRGPRARAFRVRSWLRSQAASKISTG